MIKDSAAEDFAEIVKSGSRIALATNPAPTEMAWRGLRMYRTEVYERADRHHAVEQAQLAGFKLLPVHSCFARCACAKGCR
ncbi:MAG: hypothetical protein QF773_03990 [Lentisphaeria bacterium]|nr:hypothetical protein [Lentisphaeria bacterium]